MRIWLWILGVASILAFPLGAGAADDESVSPGMGSTPPVAQALVREGDFAVKLAAALDLGTPTSEAEAEELLVKADIAPLNGWLSDYPVTPQIMGQLETAISFSVAQGKLAMSSDQAVLGLHRVAAQLDLPTPAEQGPATTEGSPPPVTESRPNQQVINNYYYDAGPPVVTYYPPPYGYAYLYDWVPYPVWWYGYWFPGFYICHDFTTVIVYQNRPVVVSNHFHDHHTGHTGWVDPRGHQGEHDRRPESELRTAAGARYRTLGDMQRGVRMAGPSWEEGKKPAERATRGMDRLRDPDMRRSTSPSYARSTRVPLPGGGRAVRGDIRSSSGEAFRGSSGRVVHPSARPYLAREQSRYVPSQRSVTAYGIRGSYGQWGGQGARSSRSFSNAAIGSSVVRGHTTSFGGIGSRGGFGGARSRP